ncbi:MAG: ABC transporter permease, partial [Actinoplanes sp.]
MTVVTAPDAAAAEEIATAPPPRRRRLRWQRVVSPLLILAAWEAAARSGLIAADKLPAPSTVLATGWRLSADGTLGAHLIDSLTRAGVGLAIGGVLALILGAIAGLIRIG